MCNLGINQKIEPLYLLSVYIFYKGQECLLHVLDKQKFPFFPVTLLMGIVALILLSIVIYLGKEPTKGKTCIGLHVL